MPRTGTVALLGYSAPELHKCKSGWRIDYYANHPDKGVTRYRVKVNTPKDLNRRLARAREILHQLDRQLRNGWRPWDQVIVTGNEVTLGQAFDRWDRAKTGQLRHSSPYSYTSMTSILREWCRAKEMLELRTHEFNRMHAVAFLNYADEERGISNRTYNNYLTFYGMLFTWMVEQGLRTDNPFETFKRRKKGKKSRTYLTEYDRQQMCEWIAANDPDFWLPVLFIYGTLIRPGELKRLRVHHVDLDRQVVYLPGEETKTGDERTPAIPDWMAQELRAMDFHKQPGKAWLVGRDLVPSEKPIARNTLNKHWVRMRKALGWPNEKQLYSLRDTGIIDLIRQNVDLISVRDQAGHADLSTTNGYVKHAFPNGPIGVRQKSVPLHASGHIVAAPLFRGTAEEAKPIPRFVQMER